MKTCTKCGEAKPLEQFHKKKDATDGRRSECAACNCASGRKRMATPEAKARKKAYAQTDKYKEIKRAYAKSERGRELGRQYSKEGWRRNPEEARAKHRARCSQWRKTPKGRESKRAEALKTRELGRYRVYRDLHNALKRGDIERQPCRDCGGKAQAHHQDYSKPLDVVWLCPLHHALEHRRLEA